MLTVGVVPGDVRPCHLIGGKDTRGFPRCGDSSIPARLGPRERAEVELLREGNYTVEAWLPFLDIGHLPPEKQRRRITIEKSRLVRKLRGFLSETAVA